MVKVLLVLLCVFLSSVFIRIVCSLSFSFLGLFVLYSGLANVSGELFLTVSFIIYVTSTPCFWDYSSKVGSKPTRPVLFIPRLDPFLGHSVAFVYLLAFWSCHGLNGIFISSIRNVLRILSYVTHKWYEPWVWLLCVEHSREAEVSLGTGVTPSLSSPPPPT